MDQKGNKRQEGWREVIYRAASKGWGTQTGIGRLSFSLDVFKIGAAMGDPDNPVQKVSIPTEWELWAVACRTLEEEGENIADFLAERVAHFADVDDQEGVIVWLAIAGRVRQLLERPLDPYAVH
jgi:hypothetical protein